MKKVPSYLKGLAETRARVAADVERLTRLERELAEQLQKADLELAACDRLIRKFDERLDPTRIEPVAARARYGKRGNLKAAILSYLREFPGQDVHTLEMAVAIEAKFELVFFTKKERWTWVHGALGKALRRMTELGEIERLHDPDDRSGTVACRVIGV